MSYLDPNRSSLRDVQAYFHSQQSAPDHQKILSKNAAIAVEILKNKYTTEPCSKKELQVLEKIKADVHRLRGAAGESAALGDLETRIGGVLKTRAFTQQFQVKIGAFEKVVHYVRSKAGELIQSLSRAIRAQFYHGWKDKIKYEKDLRALPVLREQLSAATQKLDQFVAKKVEIEKFPPSERTVALKKNEIHIKNATKDVRIIQSKVRHAEASIRVFEKNMEKAVATRKQLVTIGGEHVTLSTADRVKLDGMYLSADTFREKLQQARVQVFSLESAHLNEGGKARASLSGLIVNKEDFENNNSQLFQALSELGLFETPGKDGAGWTKISMPQSGQVLLIDERECQDLLANGTVKQEGEPPEYVLQDIGKEALKVEPMRPQERSAGTVMLGSGTKGVYEMQKREALAFLMRGMNVMMVNYRGYGASEGEPSERGTYLDMEAAYQFIKEKHPVQDEHIIAKGMCLSGGVMAKLAENHPRINLFLDQTYAEFHGVVSRQADTQIQQFLEVQNIAEESRAKKYLFNFLSSVVGAAAKLVEPDYATLPGIKKAEGQIFIMESRQDTFTPKAEELAMLQTLKRQQKLEQTKIASIPGEHGSFWLDAIDEVDSRRQFVGRSQMDYFLQSLGLLQPIIKRS